MEIFSAKVKGGLADEEGAGNMSVLRAHVHLSLQGHMG